MSIPSEWYFHGQMLAAAGLSPTQLVLVVNAEDLLNLDDDDDTVADEPDHIQDLVARQG